MRLDLENENEKRKALTLQHENDAKRIIDSSIDISKEKMIVIYDKNWHFGVIGIVASRIKELYNRPTIVLTEENGIYKGSCRSIKGYDILKSLHHCSNLLDNYGGHPMAAGLSVEEKKISAFCKKIQEYTNNKIKEELNPYITIDYKLKFSEINNRFIRFLDYLEPFGPSNTKPIFETKNVKDIIDVQLIGKERDTLKFKINNQNGPLDAIGFKMIEHYEKLLSGQDVNIAYTIDKNYWNGKHSLQLVLKDIGYSYNE